MDPAKPEQIATDHDDYHAQHIGRTKDGLQFFLSKPFELALNDSKGCQYIALFKFDIEGGLVGSVIDSLGPRGSYLEADAKEKYYARLHDIGELEFCRIVVKPFSVKYDGTSIRLIVREPEGAEDVEAVELLPGSFMAFFEPWDSGRYDAKALHNKLSSIKKL